MSKTSVQSLRTLKMCMKLKELEGKTPEEILCRYWTPDRDVCPIDIAKILSNMKVRTKAFDFAKFDTTDGTGTKALGAMVGDEENLAILYRQDESKNNIRFTLAHELGHCCYADFTSSEMPYIEFNLSGEHTDEKEIKADIFAEELLIPTKELKGVLEEFYADSLPKLTKLADIFAVPEEAMRRRLSRFKIPYIDECGREILFGD